MALKTKTIEIDGLGTKLFRQPSAAVAIRLESIQERFREGKLSEVGAKEEYVAEILTSCLREEDGTTKVYPDAPAARAALEDDLSEEALEAVMAAAKESKAGPPSGNSETTQS